MAPRRRSRGGGGGSSDAGPISYCSFRNLLSGSIGFFMLCYLYFNFRFHFQSPTSNVYRKQQTVTKYANKPKILRAEQTNPTQPLPQEGQIEAVVFTTTCSKRDQILAQVLVYSLRSSGFEQNIVQVFYSCTSDQENTLTKQNERLTKAESLNAPTTQFFSSSSSVLPDSSSSSLHYDAIREWLKVSELAKRLPENSFLFLVEKDTVFTSKPNIDQIRVQAGKSSEFVGYGQDASWYSPGKRILPKEQLQNILKPTSTALKLTNWRDYAVEAPFVLRKNQLSNLLPFTIQYWQKLPVAEKHFAFPISVADSRLKQGLSGSLRLMTYGSQFENWDFSDEIEKNPCDVRQNLFEVYTDSIIKENTVPCTLRSTNHSFTKWKDGRKWGFINSHIPDDFLDCDSWLVQEPNGNHTKTDLWYIATHTSGHEGVSTILRRRFTYSTCFIRRMYNLASESYRQTMCPLGYNHNKRLVVDVYKQKGRNSALPLTIKDDLKEDLESKMHHPNYFGDYASKIDVKKKNDNLKKPPGSVENPENIHFVFTTTCTGYQNWQSEVLAFTALRVAQKGRFTRILSGCSNQEILAIINRGVSHPNFYFHAVPDFKDHPMPGVNDNNYTPYNKPFGIRHWLQNANPPVVESTIVMIDPDFMFLRKFTFNNGYKASDNDPKIIYSGQRKKSDITDLLPRGTALAQRWTAYLGPLVFTKSRAKENKQICGEKCTNITEAMALEYYSVGPPYVLNREDLSSFIDDYCNITVGMRKAHPDSWMEEMYGYSLAAAKHDVKHTMLDNLAVTLVENEYWSFTKDLMVNPDINGVNPDTDPSFNPCLDPVQPVIPKDSPFFIHSCRVYKGVDSTGYVWKYYKQLMPEDLFSCDAWLLEPPPADVWVNAKKKFKDNSEEVHSVYGLCTSIKLVNMALLNFKSKHCPNGFNHQKKLRLLDPRPDGFLNIGKNHLLWQDKERIKKHIEAELKKKK